MQEFDGVFDGDDVIGARGVDAVDHCRESCGFARTGCPWDQHQSALLLADVFNHTRQIQLFNGANLRGNDAQHHANVAALLEHIDAEAAQAGDSVSHVQFGCLLLNFCFWRLVIMLKAMDSISSGVTRGTSVSGASEPSTRRQG